MALVLRRTDRETWLGAAKRYAARYGLESEVEVAYEKEIAEGCDEQDAAWNACYEWDVLDFEADENEVKK